MSIGNSVLRHYSFLGVPYFVVLFLFDSLKWHSILPQVGTLLQWGHPAFNGLSSACLF